MRCLLRGALFLIFICFITNTNAVDFKKCGDLEFCAKLRDQEPNEIYTASLSDTPNANTILLDLKAKDDFNDLVLEITTLANDTVRLQVVEADSATRYQLADVLDGDPKTANYEIVENTDDGIKVAVGDVTVIVNYSPFSLQFLRNNVPLVDIPGDRLYLENDQVGQPFAVGVSFPQAVATYGVHQHAARVTLLDTKSNSLDPYRLRNVDYGNHDMNSTKSIYGAVPALYGHGLNATAGVFLHNAAQQFIDITYNEIGTEGYYIVESGSLDLFVFLGPTPKDVIAQYLTLTGTAHMPQFWVLGYHQCRYSYNTQEDVKDVIANLDNYDFPVDTIWLDIDYTDGKRYFTWNPDTFSDPEEMQANLSSTNRKLITIIDPHIKAEQGYFVYDGALEQGLFVNNSDGTVFEGNCWPGLSSYMDFMNPAAREYYGNQYSYDKFNQSTPTLAGVWNDMNEPSVFDIEEQTMPNDAVHFGGVLHRDVHNIYGFLHTMSTHQGLLKRDNGEKRPFVLTRSHFAGSQRYAAIWTGDCGSTWDALSITIPMCLNANIFGITLCGSDIGGFTGDPSEELLQRWYQAGAWLPFYRAHSASNTARREPYLFSDDIQKVFREAMEMRYRHLPYWYTVFFESIRSKLPVIRPLFYDYPNDINVINIDNQYLVGRDILVHPIVEAEVDVVSIYIPGLDDELWIDPETRNVYNGGNYVQLYVDIHSIPVFYRAGSVIVRKETARPSSVDMEDDDYTLHVVLDKENKAAGTVYIDDRTSFKYRDTFEYLYLKIEAENKEFQLSIIDEFADPAGFEFNIEAVVFYEVTETPGKTDDTQPGICTKRRYEKDSNGNSLKGMKFDLSRKVVINVE